jgi:hypothetical protein
MKIRILGLEKRELSFIVVFVLMLSILIFSNLESAKTKSRDFQRKDDLGYITRMIDNFQNETGSIPLSQDGKLVACNPIKDPKTDSMIYSVCDWHGGKVLNEALPFDPQTGQGISYYYISNGKHYQVFASLEEANDDEYNSKVFSRNISCGNRICNIARASSNTPIDISLEQYEKILYDQQNEK